MKSFGLFLCSQVIRRLHFRGQFSRHLILSAGYLIFMVAVLQLRDGAETVEL